MHWSRNSPTHSRGRPVPDMQRNRLAGPFATGRESINVEDRRLDDVSALGPRMSDAEWAEIQRKSQRVPVLTVQQQQYLRSLYGDTSNLLPDLSAHYQNAIMTDEFGRPLIAQD